MKLEESFDLCRTAEEYTASEHLKQRLRSGGTRRVLDFELVAEAIEEGEVLWVHGGDEEVEARFRYDWLQTTVEVVVGAESKTVETAIEVEG